MSEALVAVLAFVGAAVGSVLPYLASRASTRQEGAQGRREEWGRRFTVALEALITGNDERAAVGRAMLVALFRSNLATDDDRQLAVAVLEADAAQLPDGRSLRTAATPDRVASARIVAENGTDDEGNAGS